jgi:hypothetical protein
MRPQSCHSGTALGTSFFDACGFQILTYHIQDLPYIVCRLLFLTALYRFKLFRAV